MSSDIEHQSAIGRHYALLLAEVTELMRNAEYRDGYAIVLTQDCEAVETALTEIGKVNAGTAP